MTELETIEGEIVEEIGVALEVAHAPVNLFRTEDPTEVVAKATATASVLSRVLRDQKLTTQIGKSEHVRVEGWTLLGTMLGVFPVCTWTRKLDDGWEARVEARTLTGAVVGAAEAECLRSEQTWKGRDDYALRSMAQTRATSKALRQPLGFVVTLAGFDPTPAEEMPRTSAPAREGSGLTGNIQPGQPVKPAGTWAAVKKLVSEYGVQTWEDWLVFGKQAQAYSFGEDELTSEAKAEMLKLTCAAANALALAANPSDFPPPNRATLTSAWRVALGINLEGPAWRMSPEETNRPVKREPDA